MGVISITVLSAPPKLSTPSLSSLSSTSKSSSFSSFPVSINPHSVSNFSHLSLFSSLSSSSSSASMASFTLPVVAASTAGASNVELESDRKKKNVELEAASSGIVSANDLLIVGPGVLGRLVAMKWKEDHPGCQVYGHTFTTDHHKELSQMGINPCLRETKPSSRFSYVIFCAPPYPSPDYSSDIRGAVSSWNGEGCFLFTSSSAPYDCNDNGFCDENTPSVPLGRSSRTDILLKGEKVVLDNDGCVLRLAGLYTADRGAHIYWLQKGIVEARPDHILNLIHYEDAASLAVTILKKNLRGQIFLGCDNHPLSRQEIMDLVDKSGKFDEKFKLFTGTSDPLGKRLNNSKTRKELGWEPKYPSFAHFLETM